MKKSLLFCLAAATGITTAFAAEPTLYPGYSFNQISANGRVAASEVFGMVTIYDLTTGSFTSFGPTEESYDEYSLGLGNCFNADGTILLGSTTGACDAAYYQNGEWHQLDVPDPDMTNLSNGITPNGSRICGSVGLSPMTIDEDVLMQVPAYWDRNKDGGYGEYHILPHPDKDFFGEKPQYVTAISISKDGKTIVGQMVFSSGGMTVPVVYQEDEKGEWSYTLPTKELFNPAGLEPVEYPGDGFAGPSQEQFMSEEEIEAYYAALEEYYANWPPTTDYPEYENFMSDEEKDAYKEAYDKYKEAYDAWQEKSDAYWEYYDGVLNSSPNFVFNNALISTDGKYVVTTLSKPDPNADPLAGRNTDIYTPCSIDIATGTLTPANTDLSLLASGVADNGVILAANTIGSKPMTGYIIKNGEIQTIQEYIASINPAYGEWIVKNMTHEVVVGYDEGYDEDYDEIIEEVVYTGIPVATPDMSVISIWNDRSWDYSYEYFAESVVFDMNATTGISTIAASNKNLSVANGQLIIPAGFASVEIFNVSGACVKNFSGAEGAVKLNLGNGAYIAKGTRIDGSVSVIKFAK